MVVEMEPGGSGVGLHFLLRPVDAGGESVGKAGRGQEAGEAGSLVMVRV